MINRLNLLLFLLFALMGQTVKGAIEDNNYLTIKPFFIEPGETVTVDLELNNELVAYGYQTEVLLPEGFTIPNTVVGSNVLYGKGIKAVADRMYGDTGLFTLTAQGKSDGSIIILSYSSMYIPFEGNSGAVAQITFVADESIEAGVYNIQLRNSEVTVLSNDEEIGAVKDLTEITAVCGTTTEDKTGLMVAGAFNDDAFNALNDKLALLSEVTTVDMKNATGGNGKVITQNPNALVYANNDLSLENVANVVIDGICDNLQLTDGFSFAVNEEVNILAGNYGHTLTDGKFGSVVLPFEIDDNSKTAYNFYTFASQVGNYLVFEKVNEPKAGVPYLYENADNSQSNGFTAIQGAIGGEINETVTDEWTMKGTYIPIIITDSSILEHTYYISNNMIMCATEELVINPFRVYLEGPTYSDAFGQGEQRPIAIHIGNLTNIDSVVDEEGKDAIIYNISGQKTTDITNGIYIINGKKYYKKK